ncbi:hypothetical protein [Achromobacter marplatensis]|uniref:Uncharacterized protein n=1 Tax=Achromobacter marplatensis TaxID=470868 RepID=A0AA42WEQ5_9BURK|nr:hypothetical protein [Achromobacter marplatensis]MDH2052557.1 hypothetical protein [Achromobacter marplatensis]
MNPTKEIVLLERARLGLIHTLVILDAANRLSPPDTVDVNSLMGAARDLLGCHLEEIDSALASISAGGAK